MDTAARKSKAPAAIEDADALSLVLQAKPIDPQRTASLTIVRDTGVPRSMGSMAKQDLIIRLKEVAASHGYKPEQFASRGADTGADSTYQGEVLAVNEAGKRRVFVGIFITRLGGTTYRCYFQADAGDSLSRGEFDRWIGSLNLNGENIGTTIAGAAKTSGSPLDSLASLPAPSTSSEAGVGAVPQPSLPVSASVSDLVNKYRNSLVVIEGEKGVGSGFVCLIDGKPTLLTNAHVMSDNPQPRFSSINGVALTVGVAALATECDVCRIEAPANASSLELLSDIDSAVHIGDTVAVLGNAEGAGVVKPLEGKVVGIGPNLIEVDAPFVPGNSGSPIIHVPSGKVIGIATYLMIRKVNNSSGGVDESVRRFGYRLDRIKAWEPVNWARFYAQSALLTKIQSNSKEFIKLFEDARARNLSSGKFSNPGIRRALEMFERVVRGSRLSAADADAARRKLIGDLRSASVNDINAFDSRSAYDYFRRTVADEKKFRDEIYAAFTRALDSVGR